MQTSANSKSAPRATDPSASKGSSAKKSRRSPVDRCVPHLRRLRASSCGVCEGGVQVGGRQSPRLLQVAIERALLLLVAGRPITQAIPL